MMTAGQIMKKISHGTWNAYGIARLHYDENGEWLGVGELFALAKRLKADPWALLALTRGELPSRDPNDAGGIELEQVFLGRDEYTHKRPNVIAPSLETVWVLLLHEWDLHARIYSISDQPIKQNKYRQSLTNWALREEQAPSKAPAKYHFEMYA